MKVIIYRDLQAEGMYGYELQELRSDSMMVKEQVIPGMYGFPAMHISHLSFTYKGKQIVIVCQTDEELTPAKRVSIFAGAVQFLEKNSQK